MNYAAAKYVAGEGWTPRVYTYDHSGNKELTVASLPVVGTKDEAIDAAVEYCDENGLDCETDFGY